jgi:cobaltochelatase CobN
MKKRLLPILLALLLVGSLGYGYQRWLSPTRIAMVNYEDFQVARVVKSNQGRLIRIDTVPLAELERVADYDAVLLFGRALNLEPVQQEFLRSEGIKGLKLYMEAPTNPNIDVTNLRGRDLDYIGDYLQYGGTLNYRHMLNYIRREFDGKTLFTGATEPPIALSQDLLFHLEEEALFETVDAFRSYASERGIHKPGQPRVALLTSVPGPFNANRDHVDGLIRSLADRGLNVYPMAAINRRLEFLEAIDPAAVVFMPHGRITLNDADRAMAWLKQRNVPLFGPLSVFQDHDQWEGDQQGMAGAIMTMSVVLPEFDGTVTPYAIAAKYPDELGYQIFKPIPERMEKFTALVRRWIDLRTLPNSDKRLAIYYYKGPGRNAMVAGGLEVAESLYNTLGSLRDAGYRVDNLPATLAGFKDLVARSGLVLGPYAQGDIARFLDEGEPALVAAADFDRWCASEIDPALCQAVSDRYGPTPGSYMTTVVDGQDHVAVARIEFGNVAILPQPLPGIGENTFALVHGTRTAPPHPYVASYLWTRKAFQPHAILHFGTHGSLEFTPWKQVALAGTDWADALVGGIPHFYPYTINNVGEAMIAKRRSYATIISHLTAPFMESGLHDEMKLLGDRLLRYHQLEEGAVKAGVAEGIRELAVALKIPEQLQIAAGGAWTEADYFALSNHVETLANEKVNSGLYTLNEVYEPEEVTATARLIATDPLAYSLARLDEIRGAVSRARLDDELYFDASYRQPSRRRVERVLAGEDPEAVLREVLSAADRQRSAEYLAANRRLTDGEIIGGFIAMGSMKADLTASTEVSTADLAKAEDLLVKIVPHPGRLDFIRSLESEKRFEMASKSLDPELFAQAQTIARAIPAMREGLEISTIPEVNELLRLMQKPAVYEQVFLLLADPALAERVAGERALVARENLERGLGAANLQALSLALDGARLAAELPALDRPRLEAFLDTLAFYRDHPDLAETPGVERTAGFDALAALQAVDDYGARLVRASELASERVRALDQLDKDFAYAVQTIEDNVRGITGYRDALLASPRLEMEALVNALAGGYVPPTSGGDLVRNPRTLPTGRNMYSVDAEQTPSEEAWQVGVALGEALIDSHRAAHGGAYPRKVTFTLWPGDFILTEGAQLAQIFYLLGVEPVRDPFNRVVSVRVIPLERLGRPRIDVVAQTAGQFRDLAASRIYLINQAIEMVARLDEGEADNFVRSGVVKSERLMIDRGLSPAEARELATTRVFGGVNGAYGTGIMGFVEKGDAWEEDGDVAEQYINNMGAVYGKGDKWSYFRAGVFEAALQDAEVVVQPRESNEWGALSLDHVYEFMGGLNLAVRSVTGEDPEAYFNDFRNADQARVQTLEEAVWTEAQATLFNPEYIRQMQKGSASAAEKMAENFRNTYGWNVMKPDAIRDAVWDELYDTYVQDKYDLQVQAFFEQQNPYALQEMTAVMMETARKGLWEASTEQLAAMAALHAELIEKYDAGCSGFVCNNTRLREFISQALPEDRRENYAAKIRRSLAAPADAERDSMVLEKETLRDAAQDERPLIQRLNWGLVLGSLLILAVIGFLASRRRHAAHVDEAEL